MDKYRHTVTSSLDAVITPPNQIRISSNKKLLSLYAKQACNLLSLSVESREAVSGLHPVDAVKSSNDAKSIAQDKIDQCTTPAAFGPSTGGVGYFSSVSFLGVGRGMPNAIVAAELVKRRIQNLHQWTLLSTTKVKDAYEPLEEGLDVLQYTRDVGTIVITLSTDPSVLLLTSVGYQAPADVPSVPFKATRFSRSSVERYRRARWNRGFPASARRGPKQLNQQKEFGKVTITDLKEKLPTRRRRGEVLEEFKSAVGRATNTLSTSTTASNPEVLQNVNRESRSPVRRRRKNKKRLNGAADPAVADSKHQWVVSVKAANDIARPIRRNSG